MTKQGSKDLQKTIEKASSLFVDFVVKEIEKQFSLILVDQYGNYFCQKLFQKLSDDHKMRLLNSLAEKCFDKTKPSKKPTTKFFIVAGDSRGTHALQCFIECLNKAPFFAILSEIMSKETLKYAYNKHATHVLIKFLKLSEVSPYLDGIFEPLVKNFADLSSDSNGLPVIKTALSKFYLSPYKERMIREISNAALMLAQNAYGNYSIQVALDVRFPLIIIYVELVK